MHPEGRPCEDVWRDIYKLRGIYKLRREASEEATLQHLDLGF